MFLLLLAIVIAVLGYILWKMWSYTGMKLCIIGLNLLVWLYGIFFMAALLGVFPDTVVALGGGMGDFLFALMLGLLLLVHPILLLVLMLKTKLPELLLIPMSLLALPLILLHSKASGGNSQNDYSSFGNEYGLYYNNTPDKAKDTVSGKTAEPDFKTSLERYTYYAEQGDASEQYSLGRLYYYGEEVEQSNSMAIKWMRLSAEQGYSEAQDFMAQVFYKDAAGVKRDYAEAAKWYHLLAEKGYDDAQYYLGICYKKGLGVKQSNETAYHWLKLAAEGGHKKAQALMKMYGQYWGTQRHPDSLFHLPTSSSD